MIYLLMEGDYHEEVPTRLFWTRRGAQAALDAAVIAAPEDDPYVMAFSIFGTRADCDIRPSLAAVAERSLLRHRANVARSAAHDAYVASGGIAYSTSLFDGATFVETAVQRIATPSLTGNVVQNTVEQSR